MEVLAKRLAGDADTECTVALEVVNRDLKVKDAHLGVDRMVGRDRSRHRHIVLEVSYFIRKVTKYTTGSVSQHNNDAPRFQMQQKSEPTYSGT